MHTQAPAQIDLLKQFERDVRSFQARTNHTTLKSVLNASPRDMHEIVRVLEGITQYRFTAIEMKRVVGIIKHGGIATDVDRFILDRLGDIDEAYRLLDVYAEIHGAPAVLSIGRPMYKWTAVLAKDTITV